MKYKLILSDEAIEGLNRWKKSGQNKTLIKISRIFEELENHPYVGIGHPEPLKSNLSGKWSREIDKKNRIIYHVEDSCLKVEVISTIGHYSDK